MILLELALQVGINPKKVAFTDGGEYHSACPSCGGKDRFFMHPYKPMSKCLGSYCCRRCGIYGDAIKFAREFLHYSFKEAAQVVGANNTENILPTFRMPYAPKLATLQKPPMLWIENAAILVAKAHENLLHNDEALAFLEARGLPLDAVHRYKFGWSEKDEFLERNIWGLEEQLDEGGKLRSLWIPKGLVIPIVELNNQVRRLKVRRSEWSKGDKLPKYVVVSGSMNGLSLIGAQKPVVIVVESELDAYAIDYVARDFVCTIAVGSNMKNPDNVSDDLAKQAKQLLICHDNDEAGNKMLKKWRECYTHAQGLSVPYGKDVGEYIELGGDVKSLLFQNLKGV